MRKSEHPTNVRVSLRVLLRGLPLPEGARHPIAGHPVLVIGRAKAAAWPGVEFDKGDLEGVVWTTSDESEDVASALRANARVVAVRREGGAVP